MKTAISFCYSKPQYICQEKKYFRLSLGACFIPIENQKKKFVTKHFYNFAFKVYMRINLVNIFKKIFFDTKFNFRISLFCGLRLFFLGEVIARWMLNGTVHIKE